MWHESKVKEMKLPLFLIKHHSMKRCGGVEKYLNAFLAPSLDGQLHPPTALLSGKQLPESSGQEAGWIPELVWTLWRTVKSLATA
jgi:hypothetical protein